MSLKLSGLNPLAYMGVEPSQPPQFVVFRVSPTINNIDFNIGTLWLNYTTQNVYMLVNVEKGIATWILFSGNLHFLTGNSGGPVGPDANNNINVVGDGITINVAGNPGTHTLTISAIGTGTVETLTGNSGGAVSPTAGNINVVGTGVITVVGNPGTSTLTITPSGSVASSFPTDSGTAVPAAGALTIHGGNNISTSGSGSTVTINVSGTTNHTVQLGNASGSLTSLANGTTGQVLTAQTGADPVWANATPTINFSARQSADVTNATGDSTSYTIICDNVLQNAGGGYNGVTGAFTPPVNGVYYIECVVDLSNLSNTHTIGLTNFAGHAFDSNPFNQATTSSMSTSLMYSNVLPLNSGTPLPLSIAVSGGTKTVTVQGGAGTRGCYFSGFLVAAT